MSLTETTMSKGQRGNKEAKKQKKAPTPLKATAPGGSIPAVATVAPSPLKK
jgi:hypothetical protein